MNVNDDGHIECAILWTTNSNPIALPIFGIDLKRVLACFDACRLACFDSREPAVHHDLKAVW